MIALATVAVLAAASPAGAQAHTEVAGGVGVPLGAQALAYGTQYLPPFASAPHSGTAGQQLALDAGRSPAVWGSIGLFPRPKLGVEFTASFRRVSLTGTSTPYVVAVQYSARQPPDYVSRDYRIDRSTQWPAIDGRVSELTLGASVVGYAGDAARAALRLSGGLAFVSASGTFEPLGYSQFSLGGHSVLFADDYRLTMKIARTWRTAAAGSAEVVHEMGPHLLVSFGGQVLLARAIDAAMAIDPATPDSGGIALDLKTAERALSAPPFHWRTSQARLAAGLRARF